MDANTQIANDLHLLTAPIRFLFRCVLALLFLLLAPLLYATIPFVFIAADPNSDFCMLALAYLALGPFASAFWLMIVGVLPDVYRAHKEGRVFEANHVKGFGLMFVGFFGSLGAEALFLFYLFPIPRESSDIAVNAAQWRSWFGGMGIAAFLPVILLLGWRRSKRRAQGGRLAGGAARRWARRISTVLGCARLAMMPRWKKKKSTRSRKRGYAK